MNVAVSILMVGNATEASVESLVRSSWNSIKSLLHCIATHNRIDIITIDDSILVPFLETFR